jgi:hypothetical protein
MKDEGRRLKEKEKLRKGVLIFAIAIVCASVVLLFAARRTPVPHQFVAAETTIESNQANVAVPTLPPVLQLNVSNSDVSLMSNQVVVYERSNSISLERIRTALDEESHKTKAPLTDADLQNISGRIFKKEEWHDAGSQTISALLESYYFAMREGDLMLISNCLSPKQLLDWPIRSRGTTKVAYSAAVRDEQQYQIRNMTERGNEYIIDVTHFMADGNEIGEQFEIINISNAWKIAGVLGALNYGHHPGSLLPPGVQPLQ